MTDVHPIPYDTSWSDDDLLADFATAVDECADMGNGDELAVARARNRYFTIGRILVKKGYNVESVIAGRPARDKGASAVEYGLMVAAIAAVIVGTVFALGTFVQGAFEKTCSTIAVGNELSNPADCGGTTTTAP